MSEEVRCQICDNGMPENFDARFDKTHIHQITQFHPARWMAICSYECQEKAIKFNAMWSMKNTLKNMSRIPFETFQEVFNFPEAGGYAEDKYEKMRVAPHLFIQMLDKNYFKKFMEMKV